MEDTSLEGDPSSVIRLRISSGGVLPLSSLEGLGLLGGCRIAQGPEKPLWETPTMIKGSKRTNERQQNLKDGEMKGSRQTGADSTLQSRETLRVGWMR